MASSGTVSLSIDFRMKPGRGREEALIAGKAQLKSSAVIEAADLGLRTIKGFFLTQYASRDKVGAQENVYGSINTQGSLMNAVTIKALKGSQNPVTGTTHVGTIAGGTQQISWFAVGA